jgi:hypothetical protein
MHAPATRRVEKPLSGSGQTVFAFIWTRWGFFLIAAGVTSLLAYYLAWVAPALVPVPPEVKVPYPAATRLLEGVCVWCGAHRIVVASIGAALLVPGFFTRWMGPPYHLKLSILLGCALGFSYISISAPLDRMVEAVKSALPDGREVPDFLPGNVREKP